MLLISDSIMNVINRRQLKDEISALLEDSKVSSAPFYRVVLSIHMKFN